LFADQHIDDAVATKCGLHDHHAGWLARHFADDPKSGSWVIAG
jgi:hypothetical protein